MYVLQKKKKNLVSEVKCSLSVLYYLYVFILLCACCILLLYMCEGELSLLSGSFIYHL